jgi:hypothetical protein
MTPMDTEFALDGNAAAGLLQEFFACEVTAGDLEVRHMRRDAFGRCIASLRVTDGRGRAVCRLPTRLDQSRQDATRPVAPHDGSRISAVLALPC